jgi:branched-chain amino acid transport system permease protein
MGQAALPAVAAPRAAARGFALLPALAILVAAAGLTFICSNYWLFQLTLVVAFAIAVLGLNIVTGYSGQISLGHGAFYAIGAYVTAILMSNPLTIPGLDPIDVPYWATLPVSAVVCGCLGFLLGFPALRLGGLYLALTTFALAVATPQLLKSDLLGDWTGGVQGLTILKPDPPGGLPLSADQWLYLFTLAVAAVLFVAARNLLRGRIGRALVAVRDHPLAAEAMGVDIALMKTGAFAVSAIYTGVAGSLGAIAIQFVAPDSFPVLLSIELFVGLVVGGVATVEGAIFGGIFVVLIPQIAEKISKAAPGAIYGAILIAVMYLMPFGVAGALRRLPRLLRRA